MRMSIEGNVKDGMIGVYTAADAVIGIDKNKANSVLGQGSGRLQPRNSGTDNDNIWIGRRASDCKAWRECGCGQGF